MCLTFTGQCIVIYYYNKGQRDTIFLKFILVKYSTCCLVFQRSLVLSLRSAVIRKELEISGIQDVRPKYKQNWINPPSKNGQHQTPRTRPQLQTSRKKRPWTPQERMAMRPCRNRSNDLIYGGR